MESTVLGVFRTLGLVVGWGIPAVLVLALAIFAAAGAVLGLTGAALRISDLLRPKRKVHAL